MAKRCSSLKDPFGISGDPLLVMRARTRWGFYPEPYGPGFTFFPSFPIARQNRA
jgi:hypothetical protein